jgi:hypothetical protein
MLRPSAEVRLQVLGQTNIYSIVGTDLTLVTIPGCISGGYHYVLNGFEQNMFGFTGYVMWGEGGEAEHSAVVAYLLEAVAPTIQKGSQKLHVVNFQVMCHEPIGLIVLKS